MKIFEPELPLQIDTTNKILNQISNWFVYKSKVQSYKYAYLHKKRAASLPSHYYDYDSESSEILNSNPNSHRGLNLHNIKSRHNTKAKNSDDCSLQYQLAEINVFAKFFTLNKHGRKIYLDENTVNKLGDSRIEYIEQDNIDDSEEDKTVNDKNERFSNNDDFLFDISKHVKLKLDNYDVAELTNERIIKPKMPGAVNVQVSYFLIL